MPGWNCRNSFEKPAVRKRIKHPSNRTVQKIKIAVFLLCLLPLARLVALGLTGGLGADPAETLTLSTGDWTLNFLFLTLAVTPLRKLTGWQWLARLRRTVALYSFFYACLHLGTYLVFDQFFDWPGILKDVGKRPYIAAGFFAFLLLVPLAVTSTDGMIRRLGGRRWQRLHRLVYLIAIVGVFHYLWLVKRDIMAPAWYALVLCLLLCARMMVSRKARPDSLAKPGIAPAAGIGGGTGATLPQRSRK
jgi:sulfoxide reductase heme-binding subunit YedZ